MKLAYENGVAVPEPISQNRHVVAMGMIEGAQLSKYKDIGNPEKVLKEILRNLEKRTLKPTLSTLTSANTTSFYSQMVTFLSLIGRKL